MCLVSSQFVGDVVGWMVREEIFVLIDSLLLLIKGETFSLSFKYFQC